MRNSALLVTVVAVLVCGVIEGLVLAAEEKEPSAASPTIFVPYDQLDKVVGAPARRVFLPIEEYERLRRAAEAKPIVPPVAAMLSEAAYEGRVEGDLATLEATFVINCISKEPTRFVLPMENLNVAEILSADEGLAVGPAKDGIAVLLDHPGRFELRLRLVSPVRKQAVRAKLAFAVPPAAVSRLDILVPEKDIAPAIEPEMTFFAVQSDEGTRIQTTLGSRRHMELTWQPRVEKVTELPPALYLASSARINIEETLVKATFDLRLRIAHAPADIFDLDVPAGYSVVTLSGDGLKEWTQSASSLRVALFAPVGGAYRIEAELQRVRPRTEKNFVIPAIHLTDARQEQGFFAINYADTLSVRLQETAAAAQIDPTDLPKEMREGARLAVRYLDRDFKAVLTVSDLEPQIRASAATYQEVKEDRVAVRSAINIEVRQIGVLRLEFEIPADAREVSVQGEKVERFDIRAGDAAKTLCVELAKRVLGKTALELSFELPAPRDRLEVAAIAVKGAQHHEGWIGVAVDDAFRASITATEGLTSADPQEARQALGGLLGEGAALSFGFRYIEAPYAAAIALVRKKASVTATVAAFGAVERDHVAITYTVDYAIRYARLDAFRFVLPREVADRVNITGPFVKEKSIQQGEGEMDGLSIWQVRLQRPAKDNYTLTVRLELPLAWQTGSDSDVTVPPLGVLDVERESGFLSIAKKPSLAVRPKKTEHLEPIDYRELPKRLQAENVFLAYRYFRRPYVCTFTVEKGKPASVVGTLINYQVIAASLAGDGSCTTDVLWELQNNVRQEIAVDLPESARILLIEIAGKEAAPRRRPRDGKLIIPIPRTIARQRIVLHLAYMIDDAGDTVTPPAPEDVEIVGSYWRLHVPPERTALFFATPLRLANTWRADFKQPFVPMPPVDPLGKNVFSTRSGTQTSRAGDIRVHLDPRAKAFAFVGTAKNAPLRVISLGLLPWRVISLIGGFVLIGVLAKLPRILRPVALMAVVVALVVISAVAGALLATLGWALIGALLGSVALVIIPYRVRRKKAVAAVETAGGPGDVA